MSRVVIYEGRAHGFCCQKCGSNRFLLKDGDLPERCEKCGTPQRPAYTITQDDVKRADLLIVLIITLGWSCLMFSEGHKLGLRDNPEVAKQVVAAQVEDMKRQEQIVEQIVQACAKLIQKPEPPEKPPGYILP